MARYKDKKILNSGEVVYEYSDRQVALRHNEKAKRLETLRGKISDLRSKIKKDLKSSDPEKFLTALAVALIDHTYERVGNPDSAKEGHFGVTGWRKEHITFNKGKATIKYVGKSGVKQKKEVSDPTILRALKDAYEACDEELFKTDLTKVNSTKINAYLDSFKITAKDLRGFHANREMREKLKGIRKGTLPQDLKERKKQLKDEFKQALEATAESVGHEVATLRSQYLVPGLEEQYLKDGTIMERLKKGAVEYRVIERYIANMG